MAETAEAERGTARDAAFAVLHEALAAHPALVRARTAGARRSVLGGAWGSGAALAAGLLAQGRGRALVVAPNAEAADALYLDLIALFPGRATTLLPVEEAGLQDGPELRANRSERLVALATLDEPGDGVLVVPGPVLLEDLPEPEGEPLRLRRGGALQREAAAERLAAAGLQRVALVAAPGEFSLRGDILDIYPWASAAPLRVELLDETIEELRRFEVESQRSVAVLDEIVLPLGGAPGTGRTRRLHERLPPGATVLIVDPPKLKDRLAEVAFEHGLAPREIQRALAALAQQPGADLFALDTGEPDADLSLRSVGGAARPEADVLADWLAQGRSIVLLSDTPAESARLAERLAEHGVADGARLRLVEGRLAAGFACPEPGPVLVHHHELLGRRAVRRGRPRREVASRALKSLAELQPGDHVVHLTHGVARYLGMERLAREQGEEDFLVLEFAGDTKLYVPASRIDLVERFVGADARGPRLDKLGGKTWRSRKEKVARAVQDMAAELLALQAKRNAGVGFAFPAEDALQRRFEASFPFEDTPDQASSWRTIRGDMEKPRPMDRLLVGDVGFGKTEVAVRAAFKAVVAGKQVAVLVPTTILAEQHAETFGRRMAEEAVRIEVLSRFRGDKSQEQVLVALAAGQVDVVIGTHRLLGNDVKFSDLGLVIVDEEQRFGVAHKEKLKLLRTTVDVLTLSATPIPRTLHMALSGLRDIAAIDTPPPGRRPVLTRVVRDEDGVLRRAVLHEIERGGQVFVLHNRVQSIGGIEARVHQLVPTARITVAHGQMATHELQEAVERFASGEVDVLVCTAIIESGIDIPRANTIIVTDPQNFGLADLHQLRGRVGREDTQAYAFFLVPQERLPGDAERRLKAIEEYTSLGSGLPIALRDLELRGAGNLLGGEQSGHILTVGYDMYCRLLRSAVAQARGQRPEEEPGEIEVELGLSAFLPADYVPDEAVRMSLLRRLATAARARLDQLAQELEDRFGRMPPPAKELLDLFRLRRLVRLAGLTSLLADGFGGLVLTVGDEERWEERGPFDRGEIMPVSPGRWRAVFPKHATRPADRLGWLLQRFGKSAARER